MHCKPLAAAGSVNCTLPVSYRLFLSGLALLTSILDICSHPFEACLSCVVSCALHTHLLLRTHPSHRHLMTLPGSPNLRFGHIFLALANQNCLMNTVNHRFMRFYFIFLAHVHEWPCRFCRAINSGVRIRLVPFGAPEDSLGILGIHGCRRIGPIGIAWSALGDLI